MFLSEYPCSPRRPATGFTLVEIMVGMVIGMLGLIIMMQVFTLSEGQKRTTTGGGDAQSNGAIALFGLQRDLRQAGFGVSDPNLLGCSVVLRAGVTLNGFAPVTINHASIPAGDPNTDTLLLVYSRTRGSPQGDSIVAQPATGQAGAAVQWDIYQMATPSSFSSGDMVIATPQNRATPCNLSVTTVVGANNAATYANSANVVVTTGTGLPGMTNGMLFNLGTAPQVLAYAIRNGNLTLCDYMVNDCGNACVTNTSNTAIWVPICEQHRQPQGAVRTRHHERADPHQYGHGRDCGLVRSGDAIWPLVESGVCAGNSPAPAADGWGDGADVPMRVCADFRGARRPGGTQRQLRKDRRHHSRAHLGGKPAPQSSQPAHHRRQHRLGGRPDRFDREYGFDSARHLAELPLQRNPDRGAAAQPRMAGSAERMLSKTQTRPPCGGALRARQAGVVLMMALIVLVAMTLAGIALVRSVDTTNVIAGNLAFKQSATNSGDTGYEAAAAWLAANSGALNNDALASGYASSFLPALGANQTWDNYWNTVLEANSQVVTMPTDPVTGNTVAYAIQRLCSAANIAPTAINAGCATSQTNVAVGSSSKTAGTVALTAISQTVYRITARVQGPRNTLSYVQVIVAL